VLLPYLGVLVYLIVRGHSMGQRELEFAQQREQHFQDYVSEAAAGTPAATGDSVDQLAKLGELKRNGDLTQEEFDQAKARLLA
jgi:hypothetical protein